MLHLSTEHSVGCWLALHEPPVRPGNGQPASPMRLMAHRPHLDPFISCFQNDISLATEDQQAQQEQRSSVSWSRTNTGRRPCQGHGRRRQTGPTMDPPLTSLQTLRSDGQGQVDEGYLWPVLETACLQRSLAGTYCLPGASGWTTLHKCRLMIGPQCF